MIEINALKSFILNGVTLSLTEGTLHLILGANGTGKSTLLRLLAGLIEPESGSVNVTGSAALLMQDSHYQIFGETVLEDMTLGFTNPKENQINRALEIAKNFGLKPQAKTKNLSFGEKRKLALASLLITDPDVFLLDEPTSGLDWPSTKALLADIENIQAKNKKATFVIATHEPEDFLTLPNLSASVLFAGSLVATGEIEAIREAISQNQNWGLRPF